MASSGKAFPAPGETQPDNVNIDTTSCYQHLRRQTSDMPTRGITERMTSMATERAMHTAGHDSAWHGDYTPHS